MGRELARGWFAPDGKARYEVLETLPPGEGVAFARARDRVLDRTVLLALGGEELAEEARWSGRLEQPAALTVYDVGRGPDGKVFVAAMDWTRGTPLARILPKMTRDEALAAVVAVAQVAAHAESRGVVHPRLDLEQVLSFPDGQVRVVGWSRPQEGLDPAARSVQKLLRRILVPFGRAPRALWKIVRHPYRNATHLAGDLSAYLHRESRLRAGRVGLGRRLASWTAHHPARATLVCGSVLLLLCLALAAAFNLYLAARKEDQARRIARQASEKRASERLARAAEGVREVEEADRERLAVLAERRDAYHSTEALRPTEGELAIDARLAALSSRRATRARLASAALDLALTEGAPGGEIARAVDAGKLALERGRVEFLFALAAFEEEKTLSTRTIERARILGSDHPYARAAAVLAEILQDHPGWADDLAPFEGRLAPQGRLRAVRLPRGATATLCAVDRDSRERWSLRELGRMVPGSWTTLDMGHYLVHVEQGGLEFRFPILLSRGEEEEIDASMLPETVPEGYVWIPAATMYRGGEGLNRTRYRKDRVERPFLIGRTEVTVDALARWTGKAPGPGISPAHPATNVPYGLALEYCRSIREGDWMGDLPTEEEWELAARGVAGGEFPWGDLYFPGAANDRNFQTTSGWTSTGIPETDVSIHGVLGMAGNASEWTTTSFGRGMVVTKGGFHSSGEEMARAAARFPIREEFTQARCGFRVVLRRNHDGE
ncbi:MAG: SUMF1/EgtB/PvdO family nonheme iron enzyme [Planctomycetes bacterium]|nr:SUMF1/EgtB/PvdO family nonheme iron enzyme [Planctomycetota bacterium]